MIAAAVIAAVAAVSLLNFKVFPSLVLRPDGRRNALDQRVGDRADEVDRLLGCGDPLLVIDVNKVGTDRGRDFAYV
ncbi:hypothetical protein [Streptomyces melanogenes]